MLPQVAAALALTSLAAAAPLQGGFVDLSGTVTFVDPAAFLPNSVEVGGPVDIYIRLDLSVPPVNAGMDALNYLTSPALSRIQLDGRRILDSTPTLLTNLLVVDGVGILPDAMTFQQSAYFYNGSSFTEGRVFLFVDGQGSDAWTSPDLTTFPESILLGAPGGPRAFLSVFNELDALVATAEFTSLEIDVSGEAGCVTNPNSTGQRGRTLGSGSRAVSDNAFALTADRLPMGSFGYFIAGPNDGYVVDPGGYQGILCMSSPVGRFIGPGQVLNSGQTGSVTLPIDLANFPTQTGFESILAGDTRYFQYWHRDAPSGSVSSNFTDSAAITFL